MKSRKSNKKENDFNTHEDEGRSKQQRKKNRQKVKYRHQNHWLKEDDNYQFPKEIDNEE